MSKYIGFIGDDREVTWVEFTGSLGNWHTISDVVARYDRIPTLTYLAVIVVNSEDGNLPKRIQPRRSIQSFVRSFNKGRIIYKAELDEENRMIIEADVIFKAAKM